jgi:hypothetical protein
MKRAAFLLGIAVILVLSLAHRNPVRAQDTQADASLPVYSAAGTAIPNAHAVVGHLKASRGGDTVTLTGPAVFSGAETYSCTVSIERGGPIAANATAIDGSHFRIVPSIGFQVDNGTRDGWKEDFICVGN